MYPILAQLRHGDVRVGVRLPGVRGRDGQLHPQDLHRAPHQTQQVQGDKLTWPCISGTL